MKLEEKFVCVCECPFEKTKQARKLLHKTSLHAAKTLNLALGFSAQNNNEKFTKTEKDANGHIAY